MSKYKYSSLKDKLKSGDLKDLPEDVNKEWEDIALNKYKSRLLYDTIVNIRKNKIWTNKNTPTYLINRYTGDILCFVYANNGIVKEIDFRKIKVSQSAINKMRSEEKEVYKNIWKDENLKLNESNMIRNKNVDFYVEKGKK